MTSKASQPAQVSATSRNFAEKLLTVPPPIEVAGRRIKRYQIGRAHV